MIAFASEARWALGIIAASFLFALAVGQFLRAGKGPRVEFPDVDRRARRTAEAQAQIDAARAREDA